MVDARREPDELLGKLEVEERRKKRGRLTVFFGAAPGVGKTFAMLEQAAFLRDVERRDVVVGVVETHGRFETTTLLSDFERLPRTTVAYRGTTLEEFDLDLALRRKPSLLLVDELAHTNADGLRHAKRWQDVEDLLDAGIEVYTTLNVQHIESLKDVIAQITGIVVRETVPDSVIDAADEIKLVDLPPDRLLERLQEGKVYLPDQVERAAENFFKKGNLIALRELALRKTAEHVDAEMQEWRESHGIEKTWAASDRLLVCIGPSPHSACLLRVGRRMATGLRARWFAVNVETPATLRLRGEGRARISENLRFAEQLGAETVTLASERPAEEILRFARERNVTKIVVGKPRRLRLLQRFGVSFVDELILKSGDIDIYATVGEPEEAEPVRLREQPVRRDSGVPPYLVALAATAVSTALAFAIFGRGDLTDVVMTYLLGIVIVAMRFGFRASIIGTILSVLAFDFFFVPPYFRFSVSDFRHVITFAVMLIVAVVIAGLTQRVRDQAEVALRSERRTSVLYALSRELSQIQDRAELTRAAARHVEQTFGGSVAIFEVTDEGLISTVYVSEGTAVPIDEDEGVIRWVESHAREAGLGTKTLAASRGFYVPLLASGSSRTVFGVLGIYPPAGVVRFDDPEQQRLADALAMQIAIALERARLAEANERAHLEVQTEQVRSTLLSSVSHDLRTPLAVMKGAASTLANENHTLAPAARKELTDAIVEETERLDRLIANLLDVTRLESGSVHITKEWQSLEEVVGAAFNRMETHLRPRHVTIGVPADLLAPCDGALIEQALVNLLENAAKYTIEGTPIEVSATKVNSNIVVEVSDRGPGVPAEEQERIFDKFHRGPSERTKAGVGLGLTICRAIVTTHGGRIWVENREGGGASFKFSLPLEGEPPRAGHLPELAEHDRGAA
jgi:two-component system sensor histidine kinase KdpD